MSDVETSMGTNPAESVLRLWISGDDYASINQSYVECIALNTGIIPADEVKSSKALLLIQGIKFNLYCMHACIYGMHPHGGPLAEVLMEVYAI